MSSTSSSAGKGKQTIEPEELLVASQRRKYLAEVQNRLSELRRNVNDFFISYTKLAENVATPETHAKIVRSIASKKETIYDSWGGVKKGLIMIAGASESGKLQTGKERIRLYPSNEHHAALSKLSSTSRLSEDALSRFNAYLATSFPFLSTELHSGDSTNVSKGDNSAGSEVKVDAGDEESLESIISHFKKRHQGAIEIKAGSDSVGGRLHELQLVFRKNFVVHLLVDGAAGTVVSCNARGIDEEYSRETHWSLSHHNVFCCVSAQLKCGAQYFSCLAQRESGSRPLLALSTFLVSFVSQSPFFSYFVVCVV